MLWRLFLAAQSFMQLSKFCLSLSSFTVSFYGPFFLFKWMLISSDVNREIRYSTLSLVWSSFNPFPSSIYYLKFINTGNNMEISFSQKRKVPLFLLHFTSGKLSTFNRSVANLLPFLSIFLLFFVSFWSWADLSDDSLVFLPIYGCRAMGQCSLILYTVTHTIYRAF